ncbi:MAG: hypothetical protein DMF97_18685, partial [Acidobacteria bacterium]
MTQRGRHGNGMDDIAQRAETDDQEARQFSRWSLVIGRWSLVIRRWSLVVGHWSLVVDRRSSLSPGSVIPGRGSHDPSDRRRSQCGRHTMT